MRLGFFHDKNSAVSSLTRIPSLPSLADTQQAMEVLIGWLKPREDTVYHDNHDRDEHHKDWISALSLGFALLSTFATGVAFYWFIRMKRSFRHE